jgi:streptogramin lyase
MRTTTHAKLLRTFLILCAMAVAGCGGSSGLQVSPSIVSSSVESERADGQTTDVSVTISIPNPKATPHIDKTWGYVSPATQSIRISTSEGTVYADLSVNSPGCKALNGGTTCTFDTIRALNRAVQTATATCFDEPFGPRHTLRGRILSYGSQKIVVRHAGEAIGVVMHPILYSFTASITNAAPPEGTVTSSLVSIFPKDPDGFAIPSPSIYYGTFSRWYPTPVSISPSLMEGASESPPQFQLLVNGKAPASIGASLSGTNDILSVRYSGRGGHTTTLSLYGGYRQKHPIVLTITPKPGVGRILTIPAIGPTGSLSLSPAGELWFTEPQQAAVASIDPATKALHRIAVPSGNAPMQIVAYGGLGPTEQNLIVFSEANNVIGETLDERIVEYSVPTPNAGLSGVTVGSSPTQPIWFTEKAAGKIGEMWSGNFTTYNAPTGSMPTGIDEGGFTDPGRNAVGFVHNDGGIGEYPLSHPNSKPTAITVIGYFGSVYWFTEANASRVGMFDSSQGQIREYRTAAPLTAITSAGDDWTYATDTKNEVEMIAPNGRVMIIPNPVPGSKLLAIAPGANGDVWVLTSSTSSSAIAEIIY